jgi:hypothetical protein
MCPREGSVARPCGEKIAGDIEFPENLALRPYVTLYVAPDMRRCGCSG